MSESKPRYVEAPTVAGSVTPEEDRAPPTEVDRKVEMVPGAVIADRYRIVKKLGAGAMGAVFLVEHVLMRKRFALKVLLPRALASQELVARFEREAIAAGQIVHPGVCASTDFGRLPDGAFFLVLDYVDGRSLRSVLADGALHPSRALDIARQVLAALAAAHAAGVVHRDIKPENVMIARGSSGEIVKVLDFGIAKVGATALGPKDAANLTKMGAVYGTPTYMAPEQAVGDAIDHRVDLYAVGVMLHEMITGQPPFDGEGVVILAQHVNAAPPPLVSPHGPIAPAVAALVARLLAKQPADRPESAAAAVAAIDSIEPPLGARATPTPPRAGNLRVAPAPARRVPTAAIVALAALLLIVLAVVVIRKVGSTDPEARSGRRPSDITAKPARPVKTKTPPAAMSSTDGSKGFTGKVGAVF